MQHAVDAAADPEGVLPGFEVDVGCVHAGRVGEQAVDDLDDVGVDLSGLGGGFLGLLARVPELAARAEVDADRLVEGGLAADDRHHALLGAHDDLVDGDDVERVGHGEHQAAVLVDAERHDPAPHDEVAREEPEGGRLRRGVHEVGHADVHLVGDGGDDVLFGHEALGDQDLAEAAAAVALPRQRRLDLLLGDDAAGDQQVAQLETAVDGRGAAPGQGLEHGPQVVGREGFGDVLGGARAVGVLERREVARRRQRQHGGAAQRGVAAHEPQELVRVAADQVEVDHDRRRRVVAQQPDGGGVAGTPGDVEAGRQCPRELGEQLGVVVDDREGLPGHGRMHLLAALVQSSVSA
ncbi:MAG: hypothetical protein BWY94_01796 [Actinobacteria bacterium ADurb.BinA094]|nr:MAG: hypothetical protein BWY94_01796 [Actinobacteria bacterium ADurb.BinA094]